MKKDSVKSIYKFKLIKITIHQTLMKNKMTNRKTKRKKKIIFLCGSQILVYLKLRKFHT